MTGHNYESPLCGKKESDFQHPQKLEISVAFFQTPGKIQIFNIVGKWWKTWLWHILSKLLIFCVVFIGRSLYKCFTILRLDIFKYVQSLMLEWIVKSDVYHSSIFAWCKRLFKTFIYQLYTPTLINPVYHYHSLTFSCSLRSHCDHIWINHYFFQIYDLIVAATYFHFIL